MYSKNAWWWHFFGSVGGRCGQNIPGGFLCPTPPLTPTQYKEEVMFLEAETEKDKYCNVRMRKSRVRGPGRRAGPVRDAVRGAGALRGAGAEIRHSNIVLFFTPFLSGLFAVVFFVKNALAFHGYFVHCNAVKLYLFYHSLL